MPLHCPLNRHGWDTTKDYDGNLYEVIGPSWGSPCCHATSRDMSQAFSSGNGHDLRWQGVLRPCHSLFYSRPQIGHGPR
ncbi:hypothetical protein NDU88_003913 [Pleurodeles waltl]|uniref:Uncharacterized protein n=1 Tax=Pleurodeles waltl TaxID=8319 RepID=A0AAV7UGN4_PLEWA|nr:hypothetical protein NDU88_003913 [Pleurodeles waltl]